jgi:hypothetical protein
MAHRRSLSEHDVGSQAPSRVYCNEQYSKVRRQAEQKGLPSQIISVKRRVGESRLPN